MAKINAPEAQGIQWASKQHGDKAIMLFGDRINITDLDINIDSERASTSVDVNNGLEALAEEMSLVLVPQNFI